MKMQKSMFFILGGGIIQIR